MKRIYVSHRLGSGPDREANRQAAMRWVGWVGRHGNLAPVATWIILSGIWPETPENRTRGIELDFAEIETCHEVWLVGGIVSHGMHLESDHARRVLIPVSDLSVLGPEPPDHLFRGHDATLIP